MKTILILSTKVLLMILSLAIAVKLCYPVAVNEIPVIWSVVVSWLKPPYLYLIINAIIIIIAATSRSHQTHSKPVQSEHSIIVRANFSSFAAQLPTVEETIPAQVLYDDDVVEVKPMLVNGLQVDMTEEQIIPEIVMYESTKGFETDIGTEEQIDVPKIEGDYLFDGQEMVSSEIRQFISVKEKPLFASSFGKRKPLRTNPQVPMEKIHRVPRPTKHETLENTWKMITEGRLSNKPETFEQRNDHITQLVEDHVPTRYEPGLPIQKEASPGQEELNRRVEEFIKKINEDMRIQRQESLNQYMDMISRGV